MILGLLLAANLFAQTPAGAPPAVPAPPTPPQPLAEVKPPPPIPTTPLSAETVEKIGKMVSLFDGKSLEGWVVSSNAWVVKDGAMASTGAGRGVIYTKGEYENFRLIFNMRHVSADTPKHDHQACMLIFCTPPPEGQKGLDALGGIQFQAPNGEHWDYRPGHNNVGKGEFTGLPHAKFDAHEWSQVEILANAKTGVARMAVAQPPGMKGMEVLDFNEPTAGEKGSHRVANAQPRVVR